jgi:hypothetical protein
MDEKNGVVEVVVKIEGQTIIAKSRRFSTGSIGYYGNGKVVINGKIHQVSLNVVEVGSGKKK